MNRRNLHVTLFFAALAAIFFAPVLFFGRVLVPFDNLFQYPPWNSYASQFGISIPQNALVSDLLLENFAWKNFIVESLRARELPLWNPYLFAGVPFLAAGQHSALYPLSLLFYFLPIAHAYGYFVALQFVIALLTMFAFMRVIGASRFAAIVSAIVYAFSGFMVVSTTFPMVISAAAWLPAILACVEKVCQEQSRTPRDVSREILFTLIGAVVLGVQFLAGHVEISIYILIVTAFYAVWRSLNSSPKKQIGLAGRFILLTSSMVILGITLGAVQLIPLFEVVQNNFRVGSASYDQVISYAYPLRQIVAFFMPDFFGNPTHHSYFDVFDFSFHPAPSGTIFWGTKNYVEAGAYVGILPLVLAVIAIISRLAHHDSRITHHVSLFTTLGILSLLFTFGTPLYAILFYAFPGFNQLHTPFRWVFPLTLCIAALAGIGAESLSEKPVFLEKTGFWRLFFWIGAAILALLAITWLLRDSALAVLDRAIASSNLARGVFDSGRMFYSYEFRNVILFAILLIGAGATIRIACRPIYLPESFGRLPAWKPLALALIVADLFVIGIGFYPTADTSRFNFIPPSVIFLQQDKSLYRVTSYDNPNEKVFNPNAGMFYGISDIRGYDSIIPKQFGDIMSLLAPQDELLFNRIAPFYKPDPFDSPLVNLLNVKYVLTTRPLPNAGYTLVYDDEIKIYRNERVLPRAFIVPKARVISDRAALLTEMKQFDPSREVLLETEPRQSQFAECPYSPVEITKYSGTEVIIKSAQNCAGWLVLSDSYFPGWIAQIDDADTMLFKADYNFRAIFVPSGTHMVRFKYSPLSLRVGIIGSFLAIMVIVLCAAYLLWRRFYRAEEASQVHVVAKNSLLPMASTLLMKLLTLAFAFLSLRVLGPTGTGRYAFAVTIWFFADTITDFGLGILLTREVSRDRAQANRYLTNTAILRVILWTVALLPVAIVAALYVGFFNLTLDTATALGLLMIAVLPGSIAGSFAYLFNAYEKFEYRIAVDFAMRLVSVGLGVIALILGYGFVGLAIVAIATNVLTLAVFYYFVRSRLFAPKFQFDRELIRWMFFESFPLMFNNLLSSLFFRVDVLILQPLKGDTVLGYYTTAYKFIDSLNFIPSNFTLAIFPTLSRLAASGKDAMLRAYLVSLKLLIWIALPITVGTIFVSRELILFFGGEAYLPDSAIALQVLIWFLPFSFINSVTHYVLIALGQQRFLTKAFIIGVIFNVAANLATIPSLSYVGASLVTIFSEIALLAPFYYGVRKHLARIPFWSIIWRPTVAAGTMGVALWGIGQRFGILPAIPIAGALYVALLIALGALGEDERLLLRRLLPARLHRVFRLTE